MDDHRRAVNKFTAEDRFFSAIGRFFFEFSQLEFQIKYHVAEAISLKDEHFDAIMSYDFAMLCTVAQTVIMPLNEDAATKLKKLISKCRELNNERVRMAHGLWVVGKDG